MGKKEGLMKGAIELHFCLLIHTKEEKSGCYFDFDHHFLNLAKLNRSA